MSPRDEEPARGDRYEGEGGRPSRQVGGPRRSPGARSQGGAGGRGGGRSFDRGAPRGEYGASRGTDRGRTGRAGGPREGYRGSGSGSGSGTAGRGRDSGYGARRGAEGGREGTGRSSDRGGYGQPRRGAWGERGSGQPGRDARQPGRGRPTGRERETGREERQPGTGRPRDDRYESSRGRPRDDRYESGRGAQARRPPRRWSEPGIGDDETFGTEAGRSFSRAASTGRNLWNPVPAAARRTPSRSASGRPSGVRRSTNTVGGEQVEGRQAVRELLAAGSRPVSEVWMLEGSDPSPILGEIDNLARSAHVPVRIVSARKLESVQRTETPQGVVAFAEPLASFDLVELVMGSVPQPGGPEDAAVAEGSVGPSDKADRDARTTPGSAHKRTGAAFLVVVDGVTDPQNLGAVLRSAECAGATGAVLPRHRAVHVTAAVTKAAAGAVEHLPIALVAGIPSALQTLEELGVRTVGLDERGDKSVFELGLGDEPVALVLGAEGRGLSPLSRRRCAQLASIPLHGSIPSLNVSTAAAVACFEVARGRTTGG